MCETDLRTALHIILYCDNHATPNVQKDGKVLTEIGCHPQAQQLGFEIRGTMLEVTDFLDAMALLAMDAASLSPESEVSS